MADPDHVFFVHYSFLFLFLVTLGIIEYHTTVRPFHSHHTEQSLNYISAVQYDD